jgi:hypothetical protein
MKRVGRCDYDVFFFGVCFLLYLYVFPMLLYNSNNNNNSDSLIEGLSLNNPSHVYIR